MYLDSVEVSVRDWKVTGLCPPVLRMRGIGCGCWVQSGRMQGERESLKTLWEQTLRPSMAYSDALTMKLLEIQPTRLLISVTGLATLYLCACG